MNNLLQFPSRRGARQEASLWLVCIDDGLSEAQRTALQEWLAADPAHAAELFRLAKVWDDFDVLSELSQMFPLQQHRRRRPHWLRMRYAAALALPVVVVGGYFLIRAAYLDSQNNVSVASAQGRGDSTETQEPKASLFSETYDTEVGQQFSSRLPDGTVVTLNTNTSLEVTYSAVERRVTMVKGEASFNVAPEKPRPFRVLASDRVVQALGTVFNVLISDADRLELTVSEGEVRVSPAPAQSAPDLNTANVASETDGVASDFIVNAGELAIVDNVSSAIRQIDLAEIDVKLAWQRGMLIFQGEPLEVVLAQVGRYTPVKFIVVDESIRDRRVGGYFRTGDIDGLLLALRETFGIEPSRAGDEIYLTEQ